MGNKIFFTANTQFENMGDGIIGRELLKLMRERGNLLVDNRRAPVWYDKVLNLDPSESLRESSGGFKRRIVISSIQSWFAKSNVYLALTPGHLYGSGPVTREIVYVAFMFFLKVIGVKVVRYGCSLGPFRGFSEWVEKYKAYCFSAYTARDSITINYVQSLGINKVTYFPDLAFGLDYQGGVSERKYPIGMSFRTGTISESDQFYLEKLEAHLLTSKFISSVRHSILFCSQVGRDHAYLQALKEKSNSDGDLVLYEGSNESINEIFACYDQVNIVLSNRLHVLICAASRGSIPVAVVDGSEHKKIVGVYQSVGLGDLVFDIYGEQSLDEFLDNVIEHLQTLKCKIETVFQTQHKLSTNAVLM